MRKASHEKTLHYTIGEAGGQIGEIFKQNQYDVIAYKSTYSAISNSSNC